MPCLDHVFLIVVSPVAVNVHFYLKLMLFAVAHVAGYVMKRWTSRGVGGYLTDCFRRTRAERAAIRAFQLMSEGIPTAEPLAWGATGKWGTGSRSYLIMEGLPEVTDPDREIILVCDEGYASSLAAAGLQRLGLHRATDLDGGVQAWLRCSAAAADQRS